MQVVADHSGYQTWNLESGFIANLRRRSPLAAKVFFSFVSALC